MQSCINTYDLIFDYEVFKIYSMHFYRNVVLFLFQYWLDVDKQMCHQIGLSSLCFNSPSSSLQEPLLRFCVKFYTPDPAQIEEEYTRYLFSLQIKRDLATGLLQCNDNTAALMASYIVQGKFLATLYSFLDKFYRVVSSKYINRISIIVLYISTS